MKLTLGQVNRMLLQAYMARDALKNQMKKIEKEISGLTNQQYALQQAESTESSEKPRIKAISGGRDDPDGAEQE